MNAQRSDFDRTLRSWFEDGPTVMSDRVVDDIAARIARQPQRRTWRLQGRPFVTTNVKLVAGLAAAMIIAVLAWQLLPTSPGPASRPTASPLETIGASPQPLAEGPLAPGRYAAPVGSAEVTFELPAGAMRWEAGDAAFLGVDGLTDEPAGVFLAFNVITNVMRDPCAEQAPLPVGPTPRDLGEAWAALPHATIQGPTDVSFGGFPAVHVALDMGDDLSECIVESVGLYYIGSIRRVVGAGQHVDLWAVDVGGTRVVAEASYYAEADPSQVRVLGEIVESVRFNPEP